MSFGINEFGLLLGPVIEFKQLIKFRLVAEIENVVERQHLELYREHPLFMPADEIHWLRRMLQREDVCGALRLNKKNLPPGCHSPIL